MFPAVLVLSIIIQFLAAVMALNLIKKTGYTRAWLCIAAGILLMAIRRTITLVQEYTTDAIVIDPLAEGLALLISFLMLVGVWWIREVFDNLDSLRVKAEKALENHKKAEENLEMFKKAMDSSSDAVSICTPEGKRYYQNDTFKNIFDAEKQPRSSIYANEQVGREVFQTIKNGKQWIGEVGMHGKDNEMMDIYLRAYPIWRDHEIVALVGIYTDLTEKKMIQEELCRMQRMESLSVVAGGIAHDFNNLMTAVFGYIQVAMDELPNDSIASEYLREAGSAVDSTKKLTSQLMTFARGHEPVFEILDPKDIVEHTVNFNLSGGNIKPHFDFPDDLWTIEADQGQFTQAIANLTINAKQAMPSGGNLYVKAENVDEDNDICSVNLSGECVKFTIHDEGIGIPKENLDKLFNLYFTTKEKGNGLGLSIVYNIINKHGGCIKVDSTPGEGTRFTVLMPAVTSATDQDETAETGNGIEKSSFPNNVLFMDDDDMIRDLGVKMIERLGAKVETATHGEEALDKYTHAMKSEQPFDVALMDLTVPGGLGGKKTVKELHKIDPKARVIVMTVYTADLTMNNYKEYGFSGYLAKPFQKDDLWREISRVMRIDKEMT